MSRKLKPEAIFPEWENPALEWYRLKKAGALIIEHFPPGMRLEIYNDVERNRRVTRRVEQLKTKMREEWFVSDTLLTFTAKDYKDEHEWN